MSSTSQTRLDNRNFFWVWFVAVNATLLIAALWVGAIGLLAPLIGFAGAFLSLFFAKWLAIKAHGIRVIEPALFRSDAERDLHAIVSDVATRAGLGTVPAVGVYDSPDVNAFATGASQSRSLVAFSSQLLAKLTPTEIKAVAAHEVAHIANRDMLAIVLLQGAINSIVPAVVAPLNLFRVANMFSDRFSFGVEVCLWLAKTALALALTFVGGLMVKAFSAPGMARETPREVYLTLDQDKRLEMQATGVAGCSSGPTLGTGVRRRATRQTAGLSGSAATKTASPS